MLLPAVIGALMKGTLRIEVALVNCMSCCDLVAITVIESLIHDCLRSLYICLVDSRWIDAYIGAAFFGIIWLTRLPTVTPTGMIDTKPTGREDAQNSFLGDVG